MYYALHGSASEYVVLRMGLSGKQRPLFIAIDTRQKMRYRFIEALTNG